MGAEVVRGGRLYCTDWMKGWGLKLGAGIGVGGLGLGLGLGLGTVEWYRISVHQCIFAFDGIEDIFVLKYY